MTRLACYLSMLLIIGLHSPGLAVAQPDGQVRIQGRLQVTSCHLPASRPVSPARLLAATQSRCTPSRIHSRWQPRPAKSRLTGGVLLLTYL
ncbi:hypothetical protein ABHF91_04225 [Pseudaeromonas sp. ZJS20]|uniref:hypothetical protein n=1 Tax=Pseudaeromonas aegiceratis TaxID=3153928 RepID=UPI00390CB032